MNVHIIKGIFTERNESLNACIDIGGTCIHKKHTYTYSRTHTEKGTRIRLN